MCYQILNQSSKITANFIGSGLQGRRTFGIISQLVGFFTSKFCIASINFTNLIPPPGFGAYGGLSIFMFMLIELKSVDSMFLTNIDKIMTDSKQNPSYSRRISPSDEAGRIRKSVHNMIEKLSKIPEEDWRSILSKYGQKVEGYLDFKKAFRIGLKVDLITKDLGALKSNLRIMKRNDLLEKLPEDLDTLSEVSDTEFRDIFKSVALGEDKLEHWKNILKRHIISQNSSVEPILGQGMEEISDIYIPLTVIDQGLYRKVLEQPEINSELELLAEYGNESKGEDCEQQCNERKQQIEKNNTLMCQFKRRDLIEMICCRNTSMPTKVNQEKSLCLTGNPGSGKTFLSTMIALLYGKSELDQFDFCLIHSLS